MTCPLPPFRSSPYRRRRAGVGAGSPAGALGLLFVSASLAILLPATAAATPADGAAFALAPIAAVQQVTPEPEAKPRPTGPAPLFMDDTPVEVVLEADFDAIRKDRDDENEERPGTLVIPNANGESVSLEVQLRTRGNFRLKRSTCSFPPIRVNFKTKQAENTVFEGQDKIKLVTHCQDGREEYEQYVLQEYLNYRMYELVSPQSFKVRLARITYHDTSGEKEPLTRYAMFIEDEDTMAGRLGGNIVEMPQAHPTLIDQRAAAVMEVFQYMIGNTDFSAVGLHNVKLVRTDANVWYGVPYDFDWAGIINARYATPDARLGTRTVRERVFRGLCRTDVDYAPIYQMFNERKEDFYGLYRNLEPLDEKRREKALEYLDGFYEVINDPGKLDRQMTRACRSW